MKLPHHRNHRSTRRRHDAAHAPRPRPLREDPREFALAAMIALCLIAACAPGCESCRRPPATLPTLDAGIDARTANAALDATADVHRDAPVDVAPDEPDTFDPWSARLPETSATGPQVTSARATLSALRAAVGFWRLDHDARAGCPTLDDLLHAPAAGLNTASMARDPWGSAFQIECIGTYVTVRSLGPDRARGTPDDIVQR